MKITRAAGAATLALTCVLVAALTAACTSSDGNGASSAPASNPASSPTSAPSRSAVSSASASGSTAPAGLSRAEGSYVLAGPSEDTALLYVVSGGRVVRATTTTGITDVSVSGTTVLVGRETADGETVDLLRGGKPVGLGISGFGPALSKRAEPAWVTLGASTTPGISKPGGSVLRTRSSLTGTDRVVARFPGSVSAPVWVGADLVVAVADDDGTSARIVRFVDARGTGRTLATVANAGDLQLTGGRSRVTVATDDGARIVTLRDGEQQIFARGWQPLCWLADDAVLAAQGGRLASVPISADGSAGTPRVLGRLPEGIRAFGGSCAN